MRNIFLKAVCLPCFFALISCRGDKTESSDYTVYEHDYNEIEELLISWGDIFKIEDPRYYVYFYSETCSHCKNIKNEVIGYSLSNQTPMYFVTFNKEVVVSHDISNTIGLTSVEGLSILGTPSLLDIESGVIVQNIAGETAILNYLK